jgi:hypothetical protein
MPGAIAKAIDAQKSSPYAPTLPEFLALCREAARRIGADNPALPYKPTPEDSERAKLVAAAVEEIVRKPREYDGLLWAKRPRSQIVSTADIPQKMAMPAG